MTDVNNNYDHNIATAVAGAYALGLLSDNLQANANYNAVMQGYMSQGYTAEQAKMLTDEYFRPQWINAEADRWVGRSKWCWAGVAVFVLLASQFLSVSSQDGNGVGGVVWMLILAAGLGFYAKHCSLKALAIRQQLDSPQPTVHQPHDPVIVDIQPTGVTRPSWDPRDRRAIPPPPMFPPRIPPTPPPF